MTVLAAPQLLDPHYLVATFGLAGLLLIVFAECGLLVGFFLPGDSLLFTAGLLVANDKLHVPIAVLVILVAVAAVLGNLLGYEIGRRAGPAVFRRPDSRLFRQEYVDRSSEFFGRHGARAIVLGRFVPIVRTFITVMAGASRMPFRTYAAYSAVGGVLWGAGVTVLGYYLGKVAFVRDHIDLILIGIVVVSLLPVAVELLRGRQRAARDGV